MARWSLCESAAMNKGRFIATLGMSWPWFVDSPDRSRAKRLLIIYLGFRKDCRLVMEHGYRGNPRPRFDSPNMFGL